MVGYWNATRALAVSGAVLMGLALEASAAQRPGNSGSSDVFTVEDIREEIKIDEADVADFEARFESPMHWVQSCAKRPVSRFSDGKGDIAVYAVNPGSRRGASIQCLTGGRKDDLGDGHVLIFSSATDVRCGENCWPKPEALARIGDRLLIVTSPGSDYGVEKIQRVSRNVFIVKTGMATHAPNYLVFADRGEARYLADGDIEVEDGKKLIFGVTGKKSYWKAGGAFWYDALIDQHGRTLRILNPVPANPASSPRCMYRAEFIARSGMDLFGIKSGQKICVVVH